MKKLVLIFTVVLMTMFINGQVFSQDIIYLKGDTISAKVIENGLKTIKYQNDNLPIQEIRKRNILRLEYSNGEIVDFGSSNPYKISPLNVGIVISKYIGEEMFLAEIDFNYFFKPSFAIGANIGIDVNGNTFLTAGPKCYFNKNILKRRIIPFIGLQAGIVSSVDDIKNPGFAIQLPFGLDFISSKNYNFGLVFSPRFITGNDYDIGVFLIGLKLGKNF